MSMFAEDNFTDSRQDYFEEHGFDNIYYFETANQVFATFTNKFNVTLAALFYESPCGRCWIHVNDQEQPIMGETLEDAIVRFIVFYDFLYFGTTSNQLN